MFNVSKVETLGAPLNSQSFASVQVRGIMQDGIDQHWQ